MKFYCISVKKAYGEIKNGVIQRLEEASKKRGVKFERVIVQEFDYLKDKIDDYSLLYKWGLNDKARLLEKYCLNDTITTFYSDINIGISKIDHCFLYNQKDNLPVIKTVADFMSNKEKLGEYVDYVGGFPLIVKMLRGNYGVGVIKVDSFEALRSLIDFLASRGIDDAILRQFIKHKRQGRLIVLGDEVIASHVNICGRDFRANLKDDHEQKKEAAVFPKEVQEIAVKAVHSVGLEFGGVDILFNEKTDEPYLAEVNSSPLFPNTQRLTGIDIAGQMVDYLVAKAQRLKG